MATPKKAAPKKAAPRKSAAKKAAPKRAVAKKPAAKKVTASKAAESSLKTSAEKAVNVYLGVIGQGIDMVKENLDSARKGNDKRVQKLEKRGAKLRTDLTRRIDSVEMPEFDVVGDAKTRLGKVQGQVEEAVESVKERLKAA